MFSWESVTHVCLRSVASDVCMSSWGEFKTEIGRMLFGARWVISVCKCFVCVIFVGSGGVYE